MDFSLKKLDESGKESYVLCNNIDNSFYSINRLLFDILAEYKKNDDIHYITSALNENRLDNYLSEEFVLNSLNTTKQLLNKRKEEKKDTGNYIKYKIPLIKEGDFWIYKLLAPLFDKVIFISFFIISLSATIAFFIKNHLTSISLVYDRASSTAALKTLPIFYLFFLLFIVIHEIGHAASSYRFGIKPRGIGVGLYFIFPVLYTDITNIWTLEKDKRIIINLGGIYLQLIINGILLGLMYGTAIDKDVLFQLLLLNSISIFGSLNPFFRYDGYWIYSDLFKLPNLRKKSNELFVYALYKPKALIDQLKQKSIPVPLFIYTILNTSFWIIVWISIVRLLIHLVQKVEVLKNTNEVMSWNSIKLFVPIIFLMIWLLSLVKLFFKKIKPIKKNK